MQLIRLNENHRAALQFAGRAPGFAVRPRLITTVLAAFATLVAILVPTSTAEAATDAAPRQRTTAALVAEADDLRAECADHPEANSQTGWVKSRFETCVHQPVNLTLKNANQQILGHLTFDLWVLGFAYDGSRRVDYVSSIENIVPVSVSGDDPATWVLSQQYSDTVNLGDSGTNPVITPPTDTLRSAPLAEWVALPQWILTYTSPDTGGYDPANSQIVAGRITLAMTLTSPTAVPWIEPDMAHSNIRFDYAGPVAGKYQGTVFIDARVELQLSLSDPEVDQSARHILDAQQFPERTFPSWPGKTVPGAQEPLHRLTDTTQRDANRNQAIKTCKDVWGDYSGTGLECDEYPFASTKERGEDNERYSARLIDGTDNGKGGNRLNAMYTMNRVLDGDAFYVTIVP
ncbi:NucA/NucB deoxyribonuclease domain-containing protein [Streptomyces sp. AK04-3B]|uniref:NucA/NucB deoxyribonuclease domain-containing protein n=1 Tax=Streptomyces sp. AK04-3B TaxID=3028650 RepID=UPI0029A31735|nr:NucA/NucB deoxyribonuclease domain-containing protein [Streptomyces sp. AK04-3B]MDX3804125.1 NucA/NucB deoxyribonuclease domain-containing protein [Streptomyces sp. AK04-3B]